MKLYTFTSANGVAIVAANETQEVIEVINKAFGLGAFQSSAIHVLLDTSCKTEMATILFQKGLA